MATIIEGALWTLTDAAAEYMVAQDILRKCEGEHTVDLLPADYPIYHLSSKRPLEVGFATLQGYITDAEREVERLAAEQ